MFMFLIKYYFVLKFFFLSIDISLSIPAFVSFILAITGATKHYLPIMLLISIGLKKQKTLQNVL
jgi:hypothetical protein